VVQQTETDKGAVVGTDLPRKGKVLPDSMGALGPGGPLTWWAELPQTGPGGERGGEDSHEASVPSPLKNLKALWPVKLPVNGWVLCAGARETGQRTGCLPVGTGLNKAGLIKTTN